MEKVKEVLQFLEDAKVFYVSTVDGNKPRVRPFSGIHEFEGKLYMPTSNKKKVFAQMMENLGLTQDAEGVAALKAMPYVELLAAANAAPDVSPAPETSNTSRA